MTDYFGRILVESNLLLSHKAIVRNESIENVFRRVNNFASHFYKYEKTTENAVILQLLVERRRTPDYLLVSYTDRDKGVHKARPIISYSEIMFIQTQKDVEVTVNMYPTSPIFRRSKSKYDNEKLIQLSKNEHDF